MIDQYQTWKQQKEKKRHVPTSEYWPVRIDIFFLSKDAPLFTTIVVDQNSVNDNNISSLTELIPVAYFLT